MRSGAATNTLIVHSQRERLFSELRNLVSVASQRIERNGESAVRNAITRGIRKCLKANLFLGSSIRNRERCQWAFDLFTDVFQ